MNWMFNTFKSPRGERSMFKNIPMSFRDHPFVQGMTAVGCRIRYRGPREYGGYHTLRSRATHFSIYPPAPIRERPRDHGRPWTSNTFWPWERPERPPVQDVQPYIGGVQDVQDRIDLLDQQIEGVQNKLAVVVDEKDRLESVLDKLEADRGHLVRQRRQLQAGVSDRPVEPKRPRPRRARRGPHHGDRVRQLESSLESVRERASAVREEMADLSRDLQDYNQEEQEILVELARYAARNRYNSVTKGY